jgi:NitT/TauT family transport system substrate-binding protein
MMRRRDFLRVSGAGAGAVLGLSLDRASAEPPPEITRIRLAKYSAICSGSQVIAEQHLRAEGFTDTQYVTMAGFGRVVLQAMATGETDIGVRYATDVIR